MYLVRIYILFCHEEQSQYQKALPRNLGNVYILNQRYNIALASFILARDIFIALQSPERGKIPDRVEAELDLTLDGTNYEDWFQTISQDPISLLEQTLYDTTPIDLQ